MRKTLKKIDDVLSWILLIAVVIALVFSVYNVTQAKKTDEAAFLFGYRPILVLTGSMEPYMMTNSICLTKEVNSIDEIAVGDVVTFHSTTAHGDVVNITHRIIDIDENGIISTKGDNNRVADGLPLTIDNVDSKVIGVFNQTAWLVEKWQTLNGKIMIISAVVSLILLNLVIKSWIAYAKEKKGSTGEKGEEKLEIIDAIIEDIQDPEEIDVKVETKDK